MLTINSVEELRNLPQENQFIGELPQLINSKIVFNGTGNILVCDSSVRMVNSNLTFNGCNSIIYLCKSRSNYHLNVSMNNNNVLYIGKDNFINNTMNIVLSEEKHCFIGNNCLLSFGIWMRNADPHLIYSSKTNKRLNLSKSIFVGDHVWIGQSTLILKGANIDSGSIIGAMSLIAGKRIPHNESWGGNPCKKISDSIFWEGSCVHGWTDVETRSSMEFGILSSQCNLPDNAYKFDYDARMCISFEEIDEKLSSRNTTEIIKYLDSISANINKNRFVHNI